MVEDLEDRRRQEPPSVLAERAMLEAWLEFHRTTLLMKCDGLSDGERKRRPVASSKLSLHGLVRHLAEVERNWFRRALLEDAGASTDPSTDSRSVQTRFVGAPAGGMTPRRG